MIEQFHFLRPWWLLALIPLAALIWLMIRYRFHGSSWRAVIDPRLLPFLLAPEQGAGHRSLQWLFGLVGLLAIIALAGPTWEKLPQPVYNAQSALVIALDLSRSMDAADIKPSRLERARHKIADMLNRRREGQTALLVYAADAFTVTPLTEDVETILALLPSLGSDIMPAQGSRADRALALAFELFHSSGVLQGDILLVTDGLDDLETSRIEAELRRRPGYRFSVLAIGTIDGGPIPLAQGGFLKDAKGAIVIARLPEENLHRIASAGDGVYASISSDDRDINALVYATESRITDRQAQRSDSQVELWRELGPWLLLLVMPLAALAFRRGFLWLMPVAVLLQPPEAQALEWDVLCKNQNLRAAELFDQGEYAPSADLFEKSDWKASAHYRAGDYESALAYWRQIDRESAQYNRGNALAQLGRLEEAIGEYERLLQHNPTHADALYNKQRLEELLQQQQQQQQQGQDQQSQDSDQAQQEQSAEQPGESGESEQSQADSGGQSDGAPGDAGQGEGEQSQTAEASDSSSGDSAEARQAPREAVADLDQKMTEQAAEQWLRKIPDDPGGLLRRKFLYQYRKRGSAEAGTQDW